MVSWKVVEVVVLARPPRGDDRGGVRFGMVVAAFDGPPLTDGPPLAAEDDGSLWNSPKACSLARVARSKLPCDSWVRTNKE